MKLLLEVPPELEAELAAEASQLGLPLQEHALRILALGRSRPSVPSTGAELVAYWQAEDLVGTRSDIADSPTHARAVRGQAEQRVRT